MPAPGLLQPQRGRLSRHSWDTGLGTRHCHPSPLPRDGGCAGTAGTAGGPAEVKLPRTSIFSAWKSPSPALPVWDPQPPGSAAGARQSSPDQHPKATAPLSACAPQRGRAASAPSTARARLGRERQAERGAQRTTVTRGTDSTGSTGGQVEHARASRNSSRLRFGEQGEPVPTGAAQELSLGAGRTGLLSKER